MAHGTQWVESCRSKDSPPSRPRGFRCRDTGKERVDGSLRSHRPSSQSVFWLARRVNSAIRERVGLDLRKRRPRRPRRGRGQGAARRGQRKGRGARRKARVARRAPAGDRRDAVVASRPHGHEAARPRGRIAGAPRPLRWAAGLFGFHRGGRVRTGTRACRRSRPRPRRSTGWRDPRTHPGCRRGRPPRRAAGAAPRG